MSTFCEFDLETDKCPKCGHAWKEGFSYGHNFCCGCTVCGWSDVTIGMKDFGDLIYLKRQQRRLYICKPRTNWWKNMWRKSNDK